MWMKAQSELRDFSEESAGLSRTRDEKEAAIRAQNAQPRIATWGSFPAIGRLQVPRGGAN